MPRNREPKYVILYTVPRQPVPERFYLRTMDSWTNDLDYAMKGSYSSMTSTLEMIRARQPDAVVEEAPLLEPYD